MPDLSDLFHENRTRADDEGWEWETLMFSAELLKAQIFEALLTDGVEVNGKRYGQFPALGNDDDLLFDISHQFPQTASDFTENRGRVTISGPTGGTISDLGAIAVWPLTIACFALASADAGFLGEHILRTLKGWSRKDFPAIGQQCLQNFHSFRISGPVYNSENSLFYSVVQLSASVAIKIS